jgi:hypothetical protein
VELYLHSPNTPAWRGAQLKHRGNFTLTNMLITLHTSDMNKFFTYILKCTIAEFRGPTLNRRSVLPTSRVRIAAMLTVLILGNQNVRRYSTFQQYYIYIEITLIKLSYIYRYIQNLNRDSSVSIVTRVWARRLRFDSQKGLAFILLPTVSRPALGLTKHSIQWVPGAPSSGLKRPRREAHWLPPSNIDLHSTNTSSWFGA